MIPTVPKLELIVRRKIFGEHCTIGELYRDGLRLCYTLEDVVREGEKIPGATAIPAGTYGVVVNWSNRFGRFMPLLLKVPNFEGVRIHCGNTDKDTEGCILVGRGTGDNCITESRAAFDALFPLIAEYARTGQATIMIVNERRQT
jgi:hypothetical protein